MVINGGYLSVDYAALADKFNQLNVYRPVPTTQWTYYPHKKPVKNEEEDLSSQGASGTSPYAEAQAATRASLEFQPIYTARRQ